MSSAMLASYAPHDIPPLPCLDVCRLHHSITTIGCTGGGAYKFSSLFQDRLDITLKKMDELECLMKGLEFVLHHVVGECYTFKPDPVQVRHNLVPHPSHE